LTGEVRAEGIDPQTDSAQIGISTVPVSLIKSMLPAGLNNIAAAMTLQAPGVARFATPVQATFPNIYGAAPGTTVNVFSYDHATGRLNLDGTATVSTDGQTVTTDPGSGIQFPGWFFATPAGNDPNIPVPPPNNNNNNNNDNNINPMCDPVGIGVNAAKVALVLVAVLAGPEVALLASAAALVIAVAETAANWDKNSAANNAQNVAKNALSYGRLGLSGVKAGGGPRYADTVFSCQLCSILA